MYSDYTQNPLLRPLRRLSRPQRQNLIVLILAVQLARTLILRKLALFVLCAITSASCYTRLERFLSWDAAVWGALSRAWVRAVIATFAPGRGMLVLAIDWTLHRDRCRSLWIGLPVGGRAVPVAFWLAPPKLGGKGAQRKFEDDALVQLRSWLPQGRRAVLIGDRGFRGRERMKWLKRMGFRFVLRVTGDTKIWVNGEWKTLAELAPQLGERWQLEGVRYGKSGAGEPLFVNLVAVRQALPRPKPLLTNKGKKTGQTVEATTWFLATDLPLSLDVGALYARRMQIEEMYLDSKSLLGLEQEATKEPWERLRGLMWALTIGLALDLQAGGAASLAPMRLPRMGSEVASAPPIPERVYRAESATREGMHELIVAVMLGTSPFTAELQAIAAKSERMKARPQVRDRRRSTPAPRHRTKRNVEIHVHA